MDLKISLLLWRFSGVISCQSTGVGDALDALQSMPQCGMSCVLSTIPRSECSLANITCVCNNKWFRNTVENCVASSCNVTDALAVARSNAAICNTPRRSRRNDLIGSIPVSVLAFLANTCRLFSRWYLNTKFDKDDWVMLAVLVLFVPFECLGQYGGFLGFGVDTWYVAPDDLTFAFKLFYMTEAFYLAILGLTKISILFFFLRIFPNPRFRTLCWTVMGWVAVSTTVFLLLQILQCRPVGAIWRSWKGDYPGGYHCFDINSLVYAAAASSIAQDLAILVLPLPLVLGLNTDWRRKAGIVFMFSLGVFVLATSCVRLRFLVQFARSTNPSWDSLDTLLWSGFEAAAGIIAASLPAIRLLLVRTWPRAFSSAAHRTAAQSSGCRSCDALKHRWALPGSGSGSGSATRAARRSAAQAGGGRPHHGYLSRLIAEARPGGQRGRDASELELGHVTRGSVQPEIRVGRDHASARVEQPLPHRPVVVCTGKEGSLGEGAGESKSSSQERMIPPSTFIRVQSSSISRAMQGDRS